MTPVRTTVRTTEIISHFVIIMRADIERWDAKYRNAEPTWAPDALLLEYAHSLSGEGAALDVACGSGGNVIHLAGLGYRVVGIDGSVEGLRRCREGLRKAGDEASLAVVDLDCFVLPPRCFDLIVVFRYLNRELVPILKQALRPNGIILYKTFNRNFLDHKPGFPADYVLNPGELGEFFQDLEPIASNESADMTDSTSYWIGRAGPAG